MGQVLRSAYGRITDEKQNILFCQLCAERLCSNHQNIIVLNGVSASNYGH